MTILIRWLKQQPKWLIIFLTLLLVLLVATIDYLIVIEISLSIFFLFPILLVTWFVSRAWGFLFAIFSDILWYLAVIFTNPHDYAWIDQWNAIVRLGFFICSVYLLAELKQAYEREKHLARTDALTGIINRRFFMELLHWEVQRFRRHNRPFTLAYLDVDNFKAVNDTFGHSRGDQLLCLITETMNRQLRQIDAVARLGGDEFALLLPETDYQAAEIALQRLQNQLLAAIAVESLPISFSIGAVTFFTVPDSLDQMLEKVDNLMYDVKLKGKNGINHQVLA